MTTDKKGTQILARTFFTQMRSTGYSSNQIIEVATELLDLVTLDLKGDRAADGAPAEIPVHKETRPAA